MNARPAALEDLGLTLRTRNVLAKGGIRTLEDLLRVPVQAGRPLLKIPERSHLRLITEVGPGAEAEILAALERAGLRLADPVRTSECSCIPCQEADRALKALGAGNLANAEATMRNGPPRLIVPENERDAFLRDRVRAIEAGLTEDDVDGAVLLLTFLLVSTPVERAKMLADMPATMREPLERVLVDVEKRFPPEGTP